MTDLSHHSVDGVPVRAASGRPASARKPWPLLPYVAAFVAGVSGLAVGRAMGGESSAFEDKLLLLLRFMAVLKFAGVVAAAAVTHWRCSQPIENRRAWAYVGAIAVMGLAPGLIWSLGGIAQGALLFHAGLLAFLYLAWKDDGARLPVRR